jgi:hypothetical protein
MPYPPEYGHVPRGPAASVVSQTSFGQIPAVGTSDYYARADHAHGTPAAPSVPTPSNTVVAETSFGQASSAGTASTYARGDHTHGTPGIVVTSRTTDAITKDIWATTPTQLEASAAVVEAYVVAQRIGYYDYTAGYVLRICVRDTGAGTAFAIVGSAQQDFVAEQASAMGAVLRVDNNYLKLTVTGASGVTIDWRARIFVYRVNA